MCFSFVHLIIAFCVGLSITIIIKISNKLNSKFGNFNLFSWFNQSNIYKSKEDDTKG